MIKKIKITESQFRKLVEMEHLADLGTDYPLDENNSPIIRSSIKKILREELEEYSRSLKNKVVDLDFQGLQSNITP